MGRERAGGGVQIDLLPSKEKSVAFRAIRRVEPRMPHPENLSIEHNRRSLIRDGEHKVIKRCQAAVGGLLCQSRRLLINWFMQDGDPRIQSQSDGMDPARAAAFQAALGQAQTVNAGSALPPFFHQLYFWQALPPKRLGRDGHPDVGGLIPDMGLPRRMWAGGELRFHRPLRAGIVATRNSRCVAQSRKQGRSGPLGFVTINHTIWQNESLCLSEDQNIVYRNDLEPGELASTPPIAPTGEEETHEAVFDTTLMFRYSALTFNGHRIHYDQDYSREVEGYTGLVVHGPLLAQKLMLLAEASMGPLSTFNYRATSPLMHHETGFLCRKGSDLWVRGPDGRQCMIAAATTH